ncbi:MAG: hypothetical protein EBW87_02280 [Burkholderiaceae bacterium]|nr:hypothetical protein [Burkholderiaceae bacterium]
MGITITTSTLPGGVTPICNECGISLCWDLSDCEYRERQAFWDSWVCKECNGGVPMRIPKEDECQ